MKARRTAEGTARLPCLECGARDVEITRPGWAEGLRDWLRSGGPWRPPRHTCRRCGATGDARSWAPLVPARGGWWSLPLRLLQALRRRRTMVPVPATYLAAVAVGAALGIAAQLAFGWPWWLPAAGVAAAVWLFFLSTALWGAGGSDRPLAADLLGVVNPRRAVERDQELEAERFRAAPFPLYGLPAAWTGPRYLAGRESGWSRGRRPVTTALSLGHGDPMADQGPQLRVEVRAEPVDAVPADAVRAERRRGLAEGLWLEAAPPARDAAEQVERLAAVRRRPDPAWSQVVVPVDGRPVGFQWLAEGRHWVAQAELDDHLLTLHGRDLPVQALELIRVTDLAPYLQGQRRLRRTWADHAAEER